MSIELETIALIEQSFDTYSLDGGISLREAKGIDSYESKSALKKARMLDEKNDWRNIPYRDIENIPSIFSFLDAKGVMFYLPAFMIYIIKNHDFDKSNVEEDVIFSLSSDIGSTWFKGRFKLIEKKHKNAIVSFLKWYRSIDDCCYRKEIEKALEYWKNA